VDKLKAPKKINIKKTKVWNFGKPVNWGEVSRLLYKKNADYAITVGGYLIQYVGESDKYDLFKSTDIQFDLTRYPEAQEPKMIEKLLEILK